jgi:nucleoside-diphosphate-sugar epimerase
MLIALTGSTGFVGQHTARELLSRGHDVRLLARDEARLHEELQHSARTQVVAGALEDAKAVARLVEGADAVIHVAGAIKALSREGFMATNREGSRVVAEVASRAGGARMVLVSSLAAREPQLSAYAASKAEGEAVARQVLAGNLRNRLVVVRPPAVYGPGDRATLPLIRELTKPVTTLTGTHAQRLSLIEVTDLARALATVAEGGGKGGVVYEVDDGTRGGYSFAEIAAAAEHTTGRHGRLVLLPRPLVQAAALAAEGWMKLSGKPVILNRGKVAELYHPDWVCSGPRLQDESGWKPQIRFAEGFASTLHWYRQNGWLPAP